MTDKWIVRRTNKADAYHTDTDCFRVKQAKRDPREVTENAIEFHEIEECPDCADRNYAAGVDSSPAIEKPEVR